MSGIDFSIESSVEGGEREYLYDDAVLEVRKVGEEQTFEASQEKVSLTLADRIHRVDEGINQTATIDGVVRVKTLSKEAVAEKVRYWEASQVDATNYMYCGGAIAIAGIIFGFASMPVVGGFFSVLGGGYAIYEGLRVSKAIKQIEQWKIDHAKEIAEERLVAFNRGLLYIYKQDQNGTSHPQRFQAILTKNELQGLYGEYFHSFNDQLASAHDDKSKLLLLGEAVQNSPLASPIYRYAFLSPEKVNQMDEVRDRYTNFLRAYNSVDARIKNEIDRVHEMYKGPFEMIEKEKEEALQPIIEQYEGVKLELLNNKTAKLEGPPPTGVEIEAYHKDVEREFAQREKLAEAQFEKAKKEAVKEADEKLKRLQKEKEVILREIRSDRNGQLLPLFPYALALHQEAYKLYKGEVFNLKGVPQNPETVFMHYPNPFSHPPIYQSPLPSAPPMEVPFGNAPGVVETSQDGGWSDYFKRGA